MLRLAGVVYLFCFEQVSDGTLHVGLSFVLHCDLANQIVCRLEHVQKLQLHSLVAHPFKELERLLQGFERSIGVGLSHQAHRAHLSKVKVDQSAGALDVVSPAVHHDVGR